jgi:hypothetical protein
MGSDIQKFYFIMNIKCSILLYSPIIETFECLTSLFLDKGLVLKKNWMKRFKNGDSGC